MILYLDIHTIPDNMTERNDGTPFNVNWIEDININTPAVVRSANDLKGRRALKKEHQTAWLMKAVTVIDLTTLAGDDTFCNVDRYVSHEGFLLTVF